MREVAKEGERRHRHPPLRHKSITLDWAVSLENGFVSANMFPAKYRFDVTAESCSGDYVVFGLTVNSGTQANLVGINNLYTEASPACNGGTPFVSFAYNTVPHAGQIRTSPTISANGKMVAFVESTMEAPTSTCLSYLTRYQAVRVRQVRCVLPRRRHLVQRRRRQAA
jgi:hypothetical protein